MNTIRESARTSVARGSGFAALGIMCVIVGLSGYPATALKSGGVLCLFVCFVLILKAELAPHRSVKRTEVWLMLDEKKRPPLAVAQKIVGGILQEIYRVFALLYARFGAGFLSLALIVELGSF